MLRVCSKSARRYGKCARTLPSDRQVDGAEHALVSGHGGNQVCHASLIWDGPKCSPVSAARQISSCTRRRRPSSFGKRRETTSFNHRIVIGAGNSGFHQLAFVRTAFLTIFHGGKFPGAAACIVLLSFIAFKAHVRKMRALRGCGDPTQ